MIVDINTRCWSSPNQLGPQASNVMRRVSSEHWLRGDHGPDALLEQIDCVDVAVIHGFRSQMLETTVDIFARAMDFTPYVALKFWTCNHAENPE